MVLASPVWRRAQLAVVCVSYLMCAVCLPALLTGEWHVTLCYNIEDVVTHNEQQLARLHGQPVMVGLQIDVPDVAAGIQQILAVDASGEMQRRLYLAAEQQIHADDSAPALKLKFGAPLMASQAFTAAQVGCRGIGLVLPCGGVHVWCLHVRLHWLCQPKR